MNHRTNLKKLNRSSSHRMALLRNLSVALLTHERITTTLPKAKALQPYVEKIITIAKRGEDKVATSRTVASNLNNDREITKKLMGELRERYAERKGGYTRIYKLDNRAGDNSPMAIIELVDRKAAVKEEVATEAAAN